METKGYPQPMQSIYRDDDGVIRFRGNAIIQWLFDSGKLDLNEIATRPFCLRDRMQLAQLLGYSVSGFGDLPEVDAETCDAADKLAERLLKKKGLKERKK